MVFIKLIAKIFMRFGVPARRWCGVVWLSAGAQRIGGLPAVGGVCRRFRSAVLANIERCAPAVASFFLRSVKSSVGRICPRGGD